MPNAVPYKSPLTVPYIKYPIISPHAIIQEEKFHLIIFISVIHVICQALGYRQKNERSHFCGVCTSRGGKEM